MMSNINKCNDEECYYNKDNMCHAEAITVGSSSPKCDTFWKSTQHGGPAKMAHVGACHMSNCRWNQDMSCSAEGVEIKVQGTEADCDTFEMS